MTLSKPHTKAQASLSFDAALALAWGMRAIGSVSHQKPHASSVTRRALELYAFFLGEMDPDSLNKEARQVVRVSRAIGPYDDTQLQAFQRLQDVAEGDVLPSLMAVRYGPEGCPVDAVALETKVDGMVRDIYAARFTRKAAQP